jgi:hypothetical protein
MTKWLIFEVYQQLFIIDKVDAYTYPTVPLYHIHNFRALESLANSINNLLLVFIPTTVITIEITFAPEYILNFIHETNYHLIHVKRTAHHIDA